MCVCVCDLFLKQEAEVSHFVWKLVLATKLIKLSGRQSVGSLLSEAHHSPLKKICPPWFRPMFKEAENGDAQRTARKFITDNCCDMEDAMTP